MELSKNMFYNEKKILVLCLCAMLMSCRSQQIIMPNDTVTQTKTQTKTIERDSIYVHDSIYVREYTKGDTVFIDKIVEHFKDRWLTRTDTLMQRDTTTVTQTVTQTITEQVKVVPGFYKWCTGLFWVIVVLIVGYTILKIVRTIYLKA